MMNGYIISILIFVMILVPSILGIVRYVKGKRSHGKGRANGQK